MKMKKMIIYVMMVCILGSQINPVLAFCKENKYLALKAKEISISSKKIDIKGIVDKSINTLNLEQGIKYFLNDETILYDKLTNEHLNKKNTFYNLDSIYVNNDMNIETKKITLSNVIVVDEDITISGHNINTDEFTIIYSENGNINIDSQNFNFYGIIYSPNGSVFINSKKIDIKGSIIADSINIESNKFNIEPDEYSFKLYDFLGAFRNDGYIRMDSYFKNGDLYIDCTSNKNLQKLNVYIRYDDEKEFVNIGEIAGSYGCIENINFKNKMDVIVVGIDAFKESAESNMISYGYRENNEIGYYDYDFDEDGLQDGIEIFYTKTDPYLKDSDGDGFLDGIEVLNLFTDPNKLDNDADFDNDGLLNKEEIKLGTNLYLKDTDFDGFNDLDDLSPLVRNGNGNVEDYSNKIQTGKFDKIISYINTDGDIIQCVYDFVNDRIKIEVKQNMVSTYHYGYKGEITTKVEFINGSYLINTYTYESDRITTISNNNYNYGFKYNEDCELIEISINDILLISYSYLDNGNIKTSYGNGYYIYEENFENKSIVSDTSGEIYTYYFEKSTETFEFCDSNFKLQYQYNDDGDLIGVNTNFDFQIEYSIGDKNKTTKYKIGDNTYTQHDIGEENSKGEYIALTKMISGDSLKVFENNENNIIQQYVIGNETHDIEYNFNDIGLVEKINFANRKDLKYTYNGNGFIESVKENDKIISEYTYDLMNRMISEKDYEKNTEKKYQYDMYNNIISIQTNDFNGNNIKNDNYSYSDNYGDQLINYNSKSIQYDKNGNPITYLNGETFLWRGDKLTNAKMQDKNIAFYYDNNGTIVSKEVDGIVTKYLIEGNDYIAEITNDKKKLYIYDKYAEIVGFIIDEDTYYFMKNALNDVIGIVNTDYEIICEYRYDAWGNVTDIIGNQEIGNENPYRYRSYYYDSDINMYYLQSRFYDSKICRFISMDKRDMIVYMQDNLNLYSYCNNNPVAYNDPMGTAATEIYIMSLTEFEKESKNIADDFEKYINKTNFSYLFSDNLEHYELAWNRLSGVDIVVFNTHGNPKRIGNGGVTDIDRLYTYEIKNLRYKSVKLLILLGCNNGHWTCLSSNVAYEFSKKISGTVVACDGTVQSGNFNSLFTAAFYSINDNYFREWITFDRSNLGWIIYKNKNNIVTAYTTNIYKLTIPVIMNYVKFTGFYK